MLVGSFTIILPDKSWEDWNIFVSNIIVIIVAR